MKGQWTNIYSGDLPLRSWWVDSGGECEYISIVLPEVFGINHWIRSFSEKLAKQNPIIEIFFFGYFSLTQFRAAEISLIIFFEVVKFL